MTGRAVPVGAVRVAVCADFPEEGWPSMDRVADELLAHLSLGHAGTVDAVRICPPFRRRLSSLWAGRLAVNADRGCNRLFDYPRYVSTVANQYDVFHIVDHSYAQLVHRLPADRTVVTCHDLDTFRSLLQSEEEPRSWRFKAMARHVLAGLQRAAYVTCDSAAVGEELVARGLVPSERIVIAPVGVGDQFSTTVHPEADRAVAQMIAAPAGAIEVLHVGSTIPRKRVDLLLRAVAAVRREMPQVHLVRVGGPFTAPQRGLLSELDLAGHVSVLPSIDDAKLAAVYRRAALLVLPSDREGFGLPVVEAMACGTVVAASDLPVLREVGGGLVTYFTPGDLGACAREIAALLRERAGRPEEWTARREKGVAWTRQFTWSRFADQMSRIYSELSGRRRSIPSLQSEACA